MPRQLLPSTLRLLLLTGCRQAKDAATMLGVPVSRLYGWLSDPGFVDILDDANTVDDLQTRWAQARAERARSRARRNRDARNENRPDPSRVKLISRWIIAELERRGGRWHLGDEHIRNIIVCLRESHPKHCRPSFGEVHAALIQLFGKGQIQLQPAGMYTITVVENGKNQNPTTEDD